MKGAFLLPQSVGRVADRFSGGGVESHRLLALMKSVDDAETSRISKRLCQPVASRSVRHVYLQLSAPNRSRISAS